MGVARPKSVFVPEERTWPRLVERGLAQTLKSSVWVGNFGRSGRNTRQLILDAKYVLPQFSVQVALLLVGGTDLGLFYTSPDPQPMSLAEIQSEKYLRASLIVHERNASTVRLLSLAQSIGPALERLYDKHAVSAPYITVDFYRKYRKVRAERSGFASRMPNLGPMLDEYGRNLFLIADLIQSQGILPVFITQPNLWSARVPPDLDAMFWLGAAGHFPSEAPGQIYYSPEMLEQMMAAYNERLRSVAKQKSVPLIDLAAALPKDRAFFYDEIHNNELGSRAIAALLVPELAKLLKANLPADGT